MPEFLIDFMSDLNGKSKRILESYKDKEINDFYKKKFKAHWIKYQIESCLPEREVIAVDGSRGTCPTSNGGFFFVCRALALGRDKKFKSVYTDFDYSDFRTQLTYIGRVMEHTEHLVAQKSMQDEGRDVLLIDGSLFGRMAHLPMEFKLQNNQDFMVTYFEAYMNLLEYCKKHHILLMGISKESRTSFFREFLIKEILNEKVSDDELKKKLLKEALDRPRRALKIAKSTGDKEIILLTKELIARKPDSLLIVHNSSSSGYTTPLLLGASSRWRRASQLIENNIAGYIKSNFPNSSEDPKFILEAQEVINRMLNLPAMLSFHLLPRRIDTPMRIDIPSWYFDIHKEVLEVGWPVPVDIDIDEILKLISSGYCGLNNYNVWLKAVDDEVKLSRLDFEELYLKKFEELIGKQTTPRGYRRVKYP